MDIAQAIINVSAEIDRLTQEAKVSDDPMPIIDQIAELLELRNAVFETMARLSAQ